MANDCLVTKLKGVVNNPNLTIMGELRFFNKENVNANIETNTMRVYGSNLKIKSVGNVACLQIISEETTTLPDSGYLTEITINGAPKIAIKNTDCEFYFVNKYANFRIRRDYAANTFMGLSFPNELEYSGLTDLFFPNLKGNGTITLKNSALNELFMIVGCTMSVDIEQVQCNVTNFNIGNTPSFGDISIFATNCPACTYFEIAGTNVDGSVEEFMQVLKNTNRYNITLVSNTKITFKDTSHLYPVRFSIKSIDGGLTYTLYDQDNKATLGVYNTSTETWE